MGKLNGLLAGERGLAYSVGLIRDRTGEALEPVSAGQLIAQNVPADLADKAVESKYPLFHIYCEKVSNTLREKFRTFSGKARLAVEVRVSQDRLDALQKQVELYVDAVTTALDGSRGDWGHGVFYGGGYEVSFNAAKHGGVNYIQGAKVTLEVDVSVK
jgi:hypothetical protein